MTMKTITPVVNVNKHQLKDDIAEKLTSAGVSSKEVEQYLRQQEYRKQYQQRPDVIEKRKQYRQERYQRMKLIAQLLSSK